MLSKKFKVGIIGAGSIARKMADTLRGMQEAELYAIAARELSRAEAFAQEFQATKAYGSYEELADDPEVDLVYIATPHSHHYQHARMCLLKGKPVLCEKAFTANTREAEELVRLSEEKGVFLTEAIWTRYMPFSRTIREIVDSGVIGTPTILTANLGYAISNVERLVLPDLCGGALYDVGVYPINFALMTFGEEIEKITSTCVKNNLGVDMQDSITFTYKDGRMAVLYATAYSVTDRSAVISGTEGHIVVENINNPQSISVYDTEDRLIKKTEVPDQISGYEYEVLECMEAVRAGEKESTSMPLDDSIEVMRIMDQLRGQWGLVYPQERAQQKQA